MMTNGMRRRDTLAMVLASRASIGSLPYDSSRHDGKGRRPQTGDDQAFVEGLGFRVRCQIGRGQTTKMIWLAGCVVSWRRGVSVKSPDRKSSGDYRAAARVASGIFDRLRR